MQHELEDEFEVLDAMTYQAAYFAGEVARRTAAGTEAAHMATRYVNRLYCLEHADAAVEALHRLGRHDDTVFDASRQTYNSLVGVEEYAYDPTDGALATAASLAELLRPDSPHVNAAQRHTVMRINWLAGLLHADDVGLPATSTVSRLHRLGGTAAELRAGLADHIQAYDLEPRTLNGNQSYVQLLGTYTLAGATQKRLADTMGTSRTRLHAAASITSDLLRKSRHR